MPKNDNVLVGFGYKDDAGVYKITDDTCLIQTVDFFTPVVDDPYIFGQIAAANALSDIYAMGGRPITALNITCFPIDKIDKDAFNKILLGGLDKINESGAALLGGHSVDDKELKYGLSVTGVCDINGIYSNKGALPGDILYLTKSLGTGFIVSAICTDFLEEDSLSEASFSMLKLNKRASEISVSLKLPNALTDITGFGLIGHLVEMMIASNVACDINMSLLPKIKGAERLIMKGVNPAGTKRNKKYFSKYVSVEKSVVNSLILLAYGAETSGGLVISVPELKSEKIEAAFKDAGELLFRIGVVTKNKLRDTALIHLL